MLAQRISNLTQMKFRSKQICFICVVARGKEKFIPSLVCWNSVLSSFLGNKKWFTSFECLSVYVCVCVHARTDKKKGQTCSVSHVALINVSVGPSPFVTIQNDFWLLQTSSGFVKTWFFPNFFFSPATNLQLRYALTKWLIIARAFGLWRVCESVCARECVCVCAPAHWCWVDWWASKHPQSLRYQRSCPGCRSGAPSLVYLAFRYRMKPTTLSHKHVCVPSPSRQL